MAPKLIFYSSRFWLSHSEESYLNHLSVEFSMGRHHLPPFLLKSLEQNSVSAACHLVTIADNTNFIWIKLVYFSEKFLKSTTRNIQIFELFHAHYDRLPVSLMILNYSGNTFLYMQWYIYTFYKTIEVPPNSLPFFLLHTLPKDLFF